MSGLKHLTAAFSAVAPPAPARRPGARPPPAARTARREPGPSRLAYRLNRLWLTPFYRRLFRIGLPLLLVAAITGLWLSDETRRANLTGGVAAVVENIQSREAFMVRTMEIEGASPAVDRALRAMLPVTLPASSFDIELRDLRQAVERLDAIEKVEFRIRPGGILSAVVVEREPAILWRHARGLDLLDAQGYRVASVTSREVRRDLPLIAGEGAARHTDEALALIDAAGPILPRLRGLERVGERRWDVVLDRGQRIMLPTARPLPALRQALAMDAQDGLLSRDVTVIDLRDPARPVLRMGLTAQNTLRRAAGLPEIDGDGNLIEPEEGGAKTAAAGNAARRGG